MSGGGGDSSRLDSGTTSSNPAAAGVATPAAADAGGAGHVPLALLLWDVATGAAAVMVAVTAGMLCVRDCFQVLAGSSFGFGAAATATATADAGSGAGGPGPKVTSGSSQQQQAAGPAAVWEQRTLWIALRALMPLLLTLLLLPLPVRGVWARLWPHRRQHSRAAAADAGSATAEQLTAAPADASPRPWYVSRRNPAGAIPALAAAATVPPQRLSDDGTTADAAAQDAGGGAACRQHHQQQRAALTMAITSSLYGSSTTAAAIPFAGGVGGCQRSAATGSVAQLQPTAGPFESGGARGRRVIGLVRARCWSLGSGGLQDRYINRTGGAAGGVTAAAAKAAVSAAASAAASGVGSALRRSLDSVLGAGGGSCCRRAPAASLQYGMGGIEPVHAAAAATAAAVHMRAAAEEPQLRPEVAVPKDDSALQLPHRNPAAANAAAGRSAPSGIVGYAPPTPPPEPPSAPSPPMLPLRLPAVPSPFTNAAPFPTPGPPPPVQVAAARSTAATMVLGMQCSSGSLASSGGLQGSASTGSDCGSGISAPASNPWRGGGGGLSRGPGGGPVLRAKLVGRPITAAAPTGTPDNNGPAPSATAAVYSMAAAAPRSVAATATVGDGGAVAARTGVRRPPPAPYVGLTLFAPFVLRAHPPGGCIQVHNPTGSHESYAHRLAAAMAPMLLRTASTSLAGADIIANSSNTCDENSTANASGGGDGSGGNQDGSARVDTQPPHRVLPARLPKSSNPSSNSSSTHTPFPTYQQHLQPSVELALDPGATPAATRTSITAAASAATEAAAAPAADQSPPRERQASDETAWPASPRQQQLPAAHSISNPDMSSLAIDAAIASATAAAAATGIAVAAAAAPAADVEERPARSFIGISPGAAAAPPAVYTPPSAAAALIASGTGGPPQRHSGGGGSGGRSPQPTGGYVVVHGCVQLIAWAREVAGWKPGSGGGGTAAAATTSLPLPRPPSPAPPPGLTRADSFLLLSSPAAEFEDGVLDEADADAGQRREAGVGLEVRPSGSSGGSWGGWRRQLQQLLPDCDAIGPWGMQLWRRREALQPGLLVPTGGGSSCAACTCGALLCGPFCVPIAPASSPPLELELGLTSAAPQTLRLLLVQHGTLLADFTCVLGAGPQVLLLPVPPQPQPTVMQLVFAPAAGAATASTPLLYDIATLLAVPDDVAAELAELSQVMRMEYGDGGGAANISTGGGAAWRDHYAALVSDLAYIMERAASGAVAAAAGTASDGIDTASDDPVWAVAQHLHAYLALLQASAAATTAPERGAETTPQASISANAAVSATGGASAAAAPAAVARAPATVAFVAEALHQALLAYA